MAVDLKRLTKRRKKVYEDPMYRYRGHGSLEPSPKEIYNGVIKKQNQVKEYRKCEYGFF
jgi:hypothetical protein